MVSLVITIVIIIISIILIASFVITIIIIIIIVKCILRDYHVNDKFGIPFKLQVTSNVI